MKFLILNGQTKEDAISNSDFGKKLDQIKEDLIHRNHTVTSMELNTMNLNDCIGCYNCWLKTPGICVWKDDMVAILKALLTADRVIIASPVKMSFISSLAKKVRDRQLPLVHPYLKMNGDRMGHLMRYEHQPRQMMLLDEEMHCEHIVKIYGHENVLFMSNEREVLIDELITY